MADKDYGSVVEITGAGDSHDIFSLLSTSERNYLVRNNGDQVEISSLKGKKVGLYFSASWCGPCQRFTPNLVEVYKELSVTNDFEIVFISGDENEESFNGYFTKMPWLAVPFSDSDTRENLDGVFKVNGIPYFVFLDENGRVVTTSGVEIIHEYGVEGYPFTPEHIKEIKAQEEEARKNQSLQTLLVSRTHDFVVSSDGKQVPVKDLEGKTIGLYFSLSVYKKSFDFTATLIDIYLNLKGKGDDFEIVMIPLDDEEKCFQIGFDGLPWLSLPFKDKRCEKLVRYFEPSTLPTMVIIGPDGKTVHPNVADALDEHGILAYPFTPEKFSELEEIEKVKREAQTLESILVSGDLDYVIGKDKAKIPVSDLVGKIVLLYFSAHWCPPCRGFTPKLIEAYNKIKENDNNSLEVIFISSDRDETTFDEYYSSMPWLALPYGDKRKESLGRVFKVGGIPMLVAIGSNGKTITTEARELVMFHGAEAYPFTEDCVKEIESQYAEMTKGWPDKLKHELHEHDLVLTRNQIYTCDACDEEGQIWSFRCQDCDYDLHPNCAMGEEKKKSEEDGDDEGNVKVEKEEEQKEGWVCDGDVCYKKAP